MADELVPLPPEGQFLIYADGGLNLRVRLDGRTVWLSQLAMAELFQTTKQNISLHLQNIFEEGELDQNAVVKEYLTTATDGKKYRTLHYNLDAILAVGYRVRSHVGTAFRQWATSRLSELLVKGFTMDDERLKAGRTLGDDYFDELLARIRDIRSSERMFYQKILDIYATSIDYDPRAEASQLFFQTVQNKMHWAAHGHTAAEVIAERADAEKPHMGLTSWKNAPAGPVRKVDVSIAKNYLNDEELDVLNRVVSLYLEYAELQAKSKRPMHMANWIGKLDDFLKSSDRDILTHAGKVSHDAAKLKAEAEYDKYRDAQDALPQPVDQHFEEVLDEVKRLKEAPPPAPKPKKKPSRKKKGGGE
ncbi:MAG: virulence RhuM family protein [Bacteroidales bacterium]|nr:virulence RhuM family protein [Bacteroidales bacterium]